VISAWLSSGAQTDTVPISIYGATRGAPLPSTNAIATITLVVTMITLVLGFLAYRLLTRGERGASAMRDFAAFDI